MKKVLSTVALAALIAPVANANAYTLYEKDGFKYELNGDWQIQFEKPMGDGTDVDLVFDDLEIKNGIEYALGDNVTAFGQLDFGLKKAANDPNERAHLEEAYLGFNIAGTTKFLFGNTAGATDMFGVADAQTNPVGDDAFDEFGGTSGDDLIYVETTIADMVLLAADYEIATTDSGTEGNGEFASVYAQVDVAGATIGAAFQNFDPAKAESTDDDGVVTVTDGEDYNIYGASIAYDAGVVNFGADYSIQEGTDTDPEHKMTSFHLGAPAGDSVSLGAGYGMKETEGGDDVKGWYANVVYQFPMQKNVSMIFEVEDSDEDNTDMGFITALRMKF